MFRSEAGGACDCGDQHVMLSSGFCPRHGPDRIKPQHVSENFISTAKVSYHVRLFYIVYRLPPPVEISIYYILNLDTS